MEEDLPGVIAPDFQPQAVEYQVVESSNNAEERNWWTALVIATRLNEDMIMRMRSGDVASETKELLVWQQSGSVAQILLLDPRHIAISLLSVPLQL